MQHFAYLGVIVFSFVGIAFLDATRSKLIISLRRGILPILSSFFLLLCADIIGIQLTIFHTNPAFVSGVYLFTPNLPIEEIFLLFFLPYSVLVIAEEVRMRIKS